MTRRRKHTIGRGPAGPPEHPDHQAPEAAMAALGHRFRRYDGTWCLQTMAGTWRSAWWLRRWPSDLLQVIYELGAWDHPEPVVEGEQLEMFA